MIRAYYWQLYAISHIVKRTAALFHSLEVALKLCTSYINDLKSVLDVIVLHE